MRDRNDGIRRRTFLGLNLIVFATGALGTAFYSGVAHAIKKSVPSGIPYLSPEDPQAKALSYTADVTDVDSERLNLKTSPAEAGQRCATCQLYSGAPGAEWGPCAIFSYRTEPKTNKNLVVSVDGWCRGWAPRAG